MDIQQVINNMVPIFTSKIDNNFIQKGKPGVTSSFTSNGSFSSFGSFDDNCALLIVNPNEYTICPSDQSTFILNNSSEEQIVVEEIKNPYKHEEEMDNFTQKIQKKYELAKPDKKHQERIKELKKAGLYVSSKKRRDEEAKLTKVGLFTRLSNYLRKGSRSSRSS